MFYIYALVDPRDSQTRYIGVTSNPTQRLRRHIKAHKSEAKKKNTWVSELKMAGVRPVQIILQQVPTQVEADGAEAYWIRHFRDLGAKLLNVQRGTRLPNPPALSPVQLHNKRSLAASKAHARRGHNVAT